jgi:hypothetical protein
MHLHIFGVFSFAELGGKVKGLNEENLGFPTVHSIGGGNI